jgi:hypothetical protein
MLADGIATLDCTVKHLLLNFERYLKVSEYVPRFENAPRIDSHS